MWEVGSPTPGEENKKEYESIEEGGGNESAGDEISIDSKYIQPEDLPQIKAYAGKDKTAIAGAMTGFEGEAYGLKDELLDNARYLWNLGNGALKDGKNVVHFYKYPGEYRVVLDVSSGGYSVSDILILKVVPNEIFISEIKTGVDSFLELRNPSSQEIDISGWRFVSGNQKFTFSKNSFIRPYSYLVIPSYSSGIIFDSGKGKVDFLYSSGLLADSFVYGGNLLKDQSFSRNGDNIGITKETPGSKNEKLIQKQTNVRNLSAGRQGSTLNISREVETSEVSSNYRGPTSIVGEGEDKEEKVLKEDAGLNQNQQANIVTVGGGDGINKKYYYLGVLVLIVFAGVGIYVIRRKSRVW